MHNYMILDSVSSLLKFYFKVFMESMRLYSPTGGGLNKQAPKGMKLSNYDIPEGTIIMVS